MSPAVPADYSPPPYTPTPELFSRPYVRWLHRQLDRQRLGLPVEPPPGRVDPAQVEARLRELGGRRSEDS